MGTNHAARICLSIALQKDRLVRRRTKVVSQALERESPCRNAQQHAEEQCELSKDDSMNR